jgi:solute carrier family 45 protein 1/2/4
VVVQPYVGIASDQCQLRWGRRRPFILVGASGTVFCILGLASTRTTVNYVINFLSGNIHSGTSVAFRIIVAISWLYSLNFFIQPFQGGIRALIVDICPARQQAQASAYASLMTGLGNITGYLFGFVNFKEFIGLSGVSQFTFLCIIAAIAVSTTVGLTCLFIIEEDPTSLVVPQIEGGSVFSRMKHIIWSIKTMPPVIQKVCVIQFFAWMGWFPFLFYISSFVGNMCKEISTYIHAPKVNIRRFCA